MSSTAVNRFEVSRLSIASNPRSSRNVRMLKEYAEAFSLFDRKKSGTIKITQIPEIIKEIGETVDKFVLGCMIHHCVKKKIFRIDIETFFHIMLKSRKSIMEEDDVLNAFHVLQGTADASNIMSLANFRQIMKKSGDPLNERELTKLLMIGNIAPYDRYFNYRLLVNKLSTSIASLKKALKSKTTKRRDSKQILNKETLKVSHVMAKKSVQYPWKSPHTKRRRSSTLHYHKKTFGEMEESHLLDDFDVELMNKHQKRFSELVAKPIKRLDKVLETAEADQDEYADENKYVSDDGLGSEDDNNADKNTQENVDSFPKTKRYYSSIDERYKDKLIADQYKKSSII